MERIKLAEKLLKYMVAENKAKDRECFKVEELKSLFLNHDFAHIGNALSLLKNDGFILLQTAKSDPSTAVLRSAAIRHIEEDTVIEKGYSIIKEIKDMLS